MPVKDYTFEESAEYLKMSVGRLRKLRSEGLLEPDFEEDKGGKGSGFRGRPRMYFLRSTLDELKGAISNQA